MPKEQTILIATTNPGKIIELRELFSAYAHRSFIIVSPNEVGIDLDVAENGMTYKENAEKKALAYAQASGLITLADDSGLEVDVLDGRPGLYSARYTGLNNHSSGVKKLTDAERRMALLDELKAYPQPWTAHFCCSIAIVFADGKTRVLDGICMGEIIPQERGEGGFGYDPIFELTDPVYKGLTMAELSLGQKNRISHRAVVVRQAIEVLEESLNWCD